MNRSNLFDWKLPLMWAALISVMPLPRLAMAADDTVSLAGPWRCQLDSGNRGVQERWFTQALSEEVTLPGTLAGQGIGEDVTVDTKWMGGIVDQSWFTAPMFAPYREPGNVKVPFWLQPEKYYAGAAWYQRSIDIPEAWNDRRVILILERPHWETRVWLDDKLMGRDDSLSTPHQYDLGTGLEPGQHRLTIRVDNSLVVDVGINSHSITDHTQGNWNGIVGRIELIATSPVWLDDLQIFPRLASRSIRIKGRIGNATRQPGKSRLKFTTQLVQPNDSPKSGIRSSKSINVSWGDQGGEFEHVLVLGNNLQVWDEFNPALYRLTAQLDQGGHARSVVFGFREIKAEGTQMFLNGRKIFLRGTLECAIFPRTGHPIVDVKGWRKIIRTAKAHGLNHIRFHSWCPPEAAFVAADEMGFYYQVECGSWANQSTTLGDGKPVDEWLYREAERILQAYGNHPSFLLMAYGNEPGGPRHRQYLAKWLNHWKATDGRPLHTSGSGWPLIPENEFHVTPAPRIQAWGQGLRSRINSRPPETTTDYSDYIQAQSVPVISHEIGQWCVYPNFDEIDKYTGYLKPRNFEYFREILHEHHMGDLARPFLMASGKLQTLCYKEDIESALRTPGMGGFQLLDLHDFPGQGTALVGVLDPFWESKGYVTAEEFRAFSGPTVPLARLGKRVFTQAESIEADVEIAHFGPSPLKEVEARWFLTKEDQSVVTSGKFSTHSVPIGNGTALGRIRVSLADLPAPQRYRLVVRLLGKFDYRDRNTRVAYAQNDWDVWIYPRETDLAVPSGITITDELNDQALATLNAGGKVLYLLPPSRLKGDSNGQIALGFSSIFWNTAWTRRQAPHTLGILCRPDHPALASFPTDYHSNWQWWYLVSQAGAMILDDLPSDFRPIVHVIDDWFSARKLGLLFEAKVGAGKLLVSSIDLKRNQEKNPVARQFLHSLLNYMEGQQFQPSASLAVDQVRSLVSPPSAMERLGAKIRSASSFEPDFEPRHVLDEDPSTMWHSAWTGVLEAFPHEIQIEFERPVFLRGFTALPRQDNQSNGWIKDYTFYVSADGLQWGQPVAKGMFSNDKRMKTVTWEKPVQGRFIRLEARSGHANGPWASLAELNILEANSLR